MACGHLSPSHRKATQDHQPIDIDGPEIDYSARAQWLRAAVLGANDGLVSTASLMIGVSAVNQTPKAMLVSGLAGLVAGAFSMAIGEFVSVYAQYDIELAQMERDKESGGGGGGQQLPSPFRAASASAMAFAVGALLPLLAGSFVGPWAVRVAAVCVVASLGLAGFGVAGAVLGGASAWKGGVRVVAGGWVAMTVSYGVLRLFGLALGSQGSLNVV